MAEQQGGHDNSLDFLWTIGIVMALALLVWHFGKVQIASIILHLRSYEIWVIEYVIRCADELDFVKQHLGILERWRVFAEKNIGGEVDFSMLISISSSVGQFLRFPLTLLTVLGSVLIYFKGPDSLFKHTYSAKQLKMLEQHIWPQIIPVAKLNLVNEKISTPPWNMALSPMDYCKEHNLLEVEKINDSYKTSLRVSNAYQLLSLQLGSLWDGRVDELPPHLKALFAIFIARINGDKSGADALLKVISTSAKGVKLSFAGSKSLLAKHLSSKKVASILGAHRYLTTLMMSLLLAARESGVLATSEFIWLKALDRRMWYVLNTVGRPTAVAEVCGVFAHWLAETRLGIALVMPMVDEAIAGLEIAINEVAYKP